MKIEMNKRFMGGGVWCLMPLTARTARFSKKSPWSVFFRGEMSVICHKITVKCRWNHGETFTAKINKLRPKCRWNILIASDNTGRKSYVYTRTCNCTSCATYFNNLIFASYFKCSTKDLCNRKQIKCKVWSLIIIYMYILAFRILKINHD